MCEKPPPPVMRRPDDDSDTESEGTRAQRIAEAYDELSDDEHFEEWDFHNKQDRQLYKSLLRDGSKRSPKDLAVILATLNTMKDEFIMTLREPVKKALCSRFTLEEFEIGDRVFDYGEFGDKLYLIWIGRVAIEIPRCHKAAEKLSADQVELIPLTRLDPGRVFGELALISENKTRAARVVAVKKTLLMVLTQADYEWSLGSAGGSAKEVVHFLRSVDSAVLEDVSEVDLRAMSGCLRLESHIGGHEILKQGAEVDRIIFVKTGFCKVIRQLHPRFKKTFDDYAEKEGPPPNPFASETQENSSVSTLPKCGIVDAGSIDEALGLDLGLGGRQALRKLISTYHEVDDGSASREKLQVSSTPRRTVRGRPTAAATAAASDALPSQNVTGAIANGSGDLDNMVVVGTLRAGMSFGVMEMLEGFAYQSSVVAQPWAEVYVMSKYDLIRNTAKTILHKLFCDYQEHLTDDRLIQRLRQKHRWNNYKRDLWDQIRERKAYSQGRSSIDRRTVARKPGVSDLSTGDYARVGAGEILWDKRAQTPPKPTYHQKSGKEVLFRVQCFRNAGSNAAEVFVEHESRDESMAALEEKILMTIASARFRDKFRRDALEDQSAVTAEQPEEDELQQPCGSEPLPALGQKSNSVKRPRPTLQAANTVQRTQELEAVEYLHQRSKCAAVEYLNQRQTKIEDLQKAGKARFRESVSQKAKTPRSHAYTNRARIDSDQSQD